MKKIFLFAYSRYAFSLMFTVMCMHLTYGQSLGINYEKSIHVKSVFKLKISFDKEYLITSDGASINYIDVGTFKSISDFSFDFEVTDVFFYDGQNDQAILISNTEEFALYKLNLISGLLEKLENPKGGKGSLTYLKNDGESKLFFSRNGIKRSLVQWDLKKDKEKELEFAGKKLEHYVFGSNNELLTCFSKQEKLVRKYYDFENKEIKDLTQRQLYELDNEFLPVSLLENESLKVKKGQQYNDLLLYAGGSELMFFATGTGSANAEGTSFVYLYNTKTGSTEWMNYHLTLYSFTDGVWIDSNSFILVNAVGDLFHFDIESEVPIRQNIIKDKSTMSFDVSSDFNHLIYSNPNDIFAKYDIKATDPVSVLDTHFYDFVSINNNASFSYSKSVTSSDQKKWILQDESFEFYQVNEVSAMILDEDHRKLAISESIQQNYYTWPDTVGESSFTKDSLGLFNGVFHNNQQHFVESFPERLRSNKYESIYEIDDGSIIVADLEDELNQYRLLPASYPKQIEFSKDGNFIVNNTYFDSRASVFNLKTKMWQKFITPNDEYGTLNTLQFHSLDNTAIGILDSSFVFIWDSQTEDMLYINDPEIESLEFSDSDQGFYELLKESVLDKQVILSSNPDELIFHVDNKVLIRYNFVDQSISKIYDFQNQANRVSTGLSPDGKLIYATFDFEIFVFDLNTNELLHEERLYSPTVPVFGLTRGRSKSIYFHKDKDLAFIYDGFGELKLYNTPDFDLLANVRLFDDGSWLVTNPQGLFDADKKGREKIYYKYGQNIILYDQIKERYWEPHLLDKIINKPYLLSQNILDQEIQLYPTAVVKRRGGANLEVQLFERNGGIGQVSLFVNGSLRVEDINPNRVTKFNYDLRNVEGYFYKEEVNKVSIKTFNQNGWINSREYDIYVDSDFNEVSSKGFKDGIQIYKDSIDLVPGLFGLFVGTSTYKDPRLTLDFADDDAFALQDGFNKISKGMYDEDRIELTILTSESKSVDSLSTKNNILKELDNIAAKALPHDIIVIFLSGHGVTVEDDFYYLTMDAGNFDLYQEPEKRKTATVSSKEILDKLTKIKSNKQVIVIDACHSGQIANVLVGQDKAGNTSQEKALEFLEDKMGVYILASSESNQKSFETAALEKGLMTFGLLRGMSGGSVHDGVINVIDLLSYAAKETEDIGKTLLKRTQRPVLNIAKGGNSFPIGFENKDLQVELPRNKIAIGNPTFGQLPSLSDSLSLTKYMTNSLSERGKLGAESVFLYSNADNDSNYKIKGTYTIEEDRVHLTWFILQNEHVIAGPLEKSYSVAKMRKLSNIIINNALKEIQAIEN